MTNILAIKSSAAGPASVSSQLVDGFLAQLPGAQVTLRDVGSEPVPHLSPATLGGLFGSRDGAAASTADLADAATAELKAADLIVIGSPMYNFGVTSTLKAWFDHVARAKVTFEYTAEGPKGLLHGKRAIVVEARGGFYSAGPAAAMDAQEPHLRAMLGLMGITDVTFVRAEKLAVSPEAKAASIAAAAAELTALAAKQAA